MATGITHEGQPANANGNWHGIIGTLMLVLKIIGIPVAVGASWALLNSSVSTLKYGQARTEVVVTDHEKRLNITETKIDRIAEDMRETRNDIKEILRRVK